MATRQTRSSTKKAQPETPDIPAQEQKPTSTHTKEKNTKPAEKKNTKAVEKKTTKAVEKKTTKAAEKKTAKALNTKGTKQKNTKAVEQKAQEAQKAIAEIEDRSATEYADTTTPGAPSKKTQKVKGKSIIRPTLEDEEEEDTGAQLDSDIITIDGSDVERTVRKKQKGATEAREAIQAMRKLPQMGLNRIEEENSVTNHGLSSEVEEMDNSGSVPVVNEVPIPMGKVARKRVAEIRDSDVEMEDIQEIVDVGGGVTGRGKRAVSGSKRQHAERKGTDSESSDEENPLPKKARIVDLRNPTKSSAGVSEKSKVAPKKGGLNSEGKNQDAGTLAKVAANPAKVAANPAKVAVAPVKVTATKKVTAAKKATTPKDIYDDEVLTESEANVETEPETDSDSTPVRKTAPRRLKRSYAMTMDTIEGEDIEMEDDGTPRAKGKTTGTDKHETTPADAESSVGSGRSCDKPAVRTNSSRMDNGQEAKKTTKKSTVVTGTTGKNERRRGNDVVGGKNKAAPEMDKLTHPFSDTPARDHKYKGNSNEKYWPKSNLAQVSQRPRSALNTFVKEVHHVNDDNILGGLSDHDERFGEEQRYARASPLKYGQRLTSADLVKSEPAEKQKKPREQVKNEHLPTEFLLHKKFTKHVLPVLFQWAAALKDPWYIMPDATKDAVKAIGRIYLGDDYNPSENSPEVKKAIQRLCDGWRVLFQYNATWSLIAFFNNNNRAFGDSNMKRKLWARQQLEGNRFIYRDTSTVDEDGWKGPFENELILRTFATHLTTIKDSQWVGGLSFDGIDRLPCGALALAAAAAERALKLWASGALTVENVRQAQLLKKRAIQLIPKVNERGESTTGFSIFSADKWAKPTRRFLVSVDKLSEKAMLNIIAASKPFAGKISTAMADDDSDDSDDPRCRLVRTLALVGEDSEGEGSGIQVEEAEVAGGWGLIPKSIQDLNASSDFDPIEIEDTPVPKKGKGKEVIRPLSNWASSSAAGPSKKPYDA